MSDDRIKLGLTPTVHPKPTCVDPENMTDKEAFQKDYTRGCTNCGEKPVVYAVGLCGPCTWGESETYGGNW